MKTPDKIYLNIPKVLYEKDEDTVATWDTREWDDCVNPEYISKSVLLEWAKKKQYDSTTIVADNFWQEVIDKINEI